MTQSPTEEFKEYINLIKNKEMNDEEFRKDSERLQRRMSESIQLLDTTLMMARANMMECMARAHQKVNNYGGLNEWFNFYLNTRSVMDSEIREFAKLNQYLEMRRQEDEKRKANEQNPNT